MTTERSFAQFHDRLTRLATEDRFSGSVAVSRGGAQVFAGAYGYVPVR